MTRLFLSCPGKEEVCGAAPEGGVAVGETQLEALPWCDGRLRKGLM